MGKQEWAEIHKFTIAVKGLEAIEELCGEAPTILLSKDAQAKWVALGENAA